MSKTITVALAGNPNSGKTTIFNNLTGSRQHVGNYPGVTVECKRGTCRHGSITFEFVDLPGTYSFSTRSAEERAARDFIIGERPDLVVDIIDSSNCERNCYLAVQLMELGVPLVLAFNMSDEAKVKGYEFDITKLSELFGVPIIETIGDRGEGMAALLDAIVSTATRDAFTGGRGALHDNHKIVDYGRDVEDEIETIRLMIEDKEVTADEGDARWIALQLLEGDKNVTAGINDEEIKSLVASGISRIERVLGERPEMVIAGARYGFIAGACQKSVRTTIESRQMFSDKIDAFLTNRILGIPVFLVLMYLVFTLTFTLGDLPMGWIENLFSWLSAGVNGWWPKGSESVLKSLLSEGIIGGVGSVLVFLPNILLLFMAIAILEDSGYMARVAFIMDRFMRGIGLHGKSVIPMLIGFGCSVPAIMAARTLENRRYRLVTMLVVPLMSCGSRLPIYLLIIPAFFPESWNAPMLWIIYIIGILLAVLIAKVLRSTILKGEPVPFVMELPPYRMPTLKGVLIHMWERGFLYLKRAGTIILAISIIMWAATRYPALPGRVKTDYDNKRADVERRVSDIREKERLLSVITNEEAGIALGNSIAGRIGHGIEPVMRPMGFDWKIGTAFIGALAAKEVFVSQMGIVCSVGKVNEESESLREKLRKSYPPLVGFCVMLFALISAPCMATIAVTRRESNSWKWAFLQLGGLTLVGYIVTVIVFQAGSFFRIGI